MLLLEAIPVGLWALLVLLILALFVPKQSGGSKYKDKELKDVYKQLNGHLEHDLEESREKIADLSDRLAQLEKQNQEVKRKHAVQLEEIKKKHAAEKKWPKKIKAAMTLVAPVAMGLLTGDFKVAGVVGAAALVFSLFSSDSNYEEDIDF